MPGGEVRKRQQGAPERAADAAGGDGEVVSGSFVGVRVFMVRHQWRVFAVLLALWTALFFYNYSDEKFRLGSVLRDKLWWIGGLFLFMFVGGVSYADRDTSSLSAYAMLNEGGQGIIGQMSPEEVMGMHRAPAGEKKKDVPKAAGVNHKLFDSLEGGRFNRNGPCPCGSRKKFKACCFNTQQNLKASAGVTPTSNIDLYAE